MGKHKQGVAMRQITKEYYMVLVGQINRGTCFKKVYKARNVIGNNIYYLRN